jgi:hypothetical protein
MKIEIGLLCMVPRLVSWLEKEKSWFLICNLIL